MVYMLKFGAILMVNVTIYIAYMDPMGLADKFARLRKPYAASGGTFEGWCNKFIGKPSKKAAIHQKQRNSRTSPKHHC